MVKSILHKINYDEALIYLLLVSQLFEEHWGSKVLIIAALKGIFFFVKARQLPKIKVWGYILYFGIAFTSLFWTIDVNQSIIMVGGLLPFLIIPFWISSIRAVINFRIVFMRVSITYLAIGAFTLIAALIRYLNTGDISEFFYHSLVSSIGVNAIYVSLWFLMVLFFNIQLIKKNPRNTLRNISSVLLAVYILLLSSKLMVVIMLISCMVLIYPEILKKLNSVKRGMVVLLSFLVLTVVLISFSGSVLKRFREISNFNEVEKVLTLNEFGQVYPWNGLSLRVFQIRCFWDIEKSESFNPLTGVGVNNGQIPLNERYIAYDLYQGKEGEINGGFLRYNFHNQYAQTLIETGVFGFIGLLLILGQLLWNGKVEYNHIFTIIVLVFVFLMFTESILVRQKGIIAFALFPLLALEFKKLLNA
jgi:hypothetical protein